MVSDIRRYISLMETETSRDDHAENLEIIRSIPGFEVHHDNPGGEWLDRKRAHADSALDVSQLGELAKGITGSVTAILRGVNGQGVQVSMDTIRRLKGANDEARHPGEAKYDRLAADIDANGWNPEPIHIVVNHRGDAFIGEGNTRVAHAIARGETGMRAFIYYYNGGEMAPGPFSLKRYADKVLLSRNDFSAYHRRNPSRRTAH